MSKDSVLGWTLVLLVAISLFLSFTIWFRIPGHLSIARMIQTEKEVDPILMVRPEKILVNLGDSFNTVLKTSSPMYDRTWDLSRKLLVEHWSKSPKSIHNMNKEYFTHKKNLEVFFPIPLPVSFIKQIFNISSGETSPLDGKLIKSFVLVDDSGLLIYFIDSDGNFYKIGESSNTQEMSSLIKDVKDSNPPLFASLTADINLKIVGDVYVSLLANELPLYSLKKELIGEEQLASKFFADFSVTRRIEEKDGTVIYTDGQQGLKIYSDGAIEYNLPVSREQRKTQNLYEAFKTAVDFVATHDKWPSGVYLASYEIQEKESGPIYLFKFRVKVNGIKVINLDGYISIAVEAGQVKNYFRNVPFSTKPKGIKSLMAPIEALNIAVSTKNIRVINDIYPGYMIDSEKLKPVWVVETSGMEVIVQDLSE